MNHDTTVTTTDPASISQNHLSQSVDRSLTFVFRAGRKIFRLTADDGRQFVIQSRSRLDLRAGPANGRSGDRRIYATDSSAAG